MNTNMDARIDTNAAAGGLDDRESVREADGDDVQGFGGKLAGGMEFGGKIGGGMDLALPSITLPSVLMPSQPGEEIPTRRPIVR